MDCHDWPVKRIGPLPDTGHGRARDIPVWLLGDARAVVGQEHRSAVLRLKPGLTVPTLGGAAGSTRFLVSIVRYTAYWTVTLAVFELRTRNQLSHR